MTGMERLDKLEGFVKETAKEVRELGKRVGKLEVMVAELRSSHGRGPDADVFDEALEEAGGEI